ncbi:TonB-dependent receptor [Membranihabitans maritimus]|uniref:TonB-dependent receptor n=1 Tax=Membranihabitans maritimus TaxID=2904244 RepID=UPI001F1A945B|nr:TonB-dependent receptor [Membranihabitans maritimus]
MKLITILCCIVCVQLSATKMDAQYVSLDERDAKLEQVILKIRKQTGYNFLFNNRILERAKPVTVRFENMPLEDALGNVFAEQPLTYSIIEKTIVVREVETKLNEVKTIKLQHIDEYITPFKEDQLLASVSGIVTESSGEVLIGVNVTVKGTTRGATTDFNGRFDVEADLSDTLVFSYIGYKTLEVPVEGRSQINVTMSEDVAELEELVVVGYGSVKKSDLTGSVSSVNGELISDRNSIQVSDALQGAMPGISVSRGAGSAPGSSATVRIRGITTLSNNDPLVIVDGVPVNSIDDVNVNDVESISVLKDAASSSIYGARASAGVVLITTKRAKNGQILFEYSNQYGIERPTGLPQSVGPIRYMEMLNELQWNDNNNNPEGEHPVYPRDYIDNYVQNNRTNPDEFPITDWADLILNDYSTRESHQLGFSLGTEKLNTKGSFRYERSNALWNNKSFKRFTARVNNDLKINKFLSAQVDISLRRTIDERPNINPMNRSRVTGPIYAAMWSDGRIASGKQGDNAWGMVEYGGFDNDWANNMISRLGIDFNPFNDLKISAVVSPNFSSTKTKTFQKAIPTYIAEDPTVFDTYLSNFNSTNLNEVRSENYSITGQLLANYTKEFKDHNFNLLGGFEEYYYFQESLGGARRDYALQDFPYLDIGPLEGRGNSGSAIENSYRSFFGRLMYDYKGKYLIQANIRYDGSSRFAREHRWGAFPSLSAGWVISEEPWLNQPSWLSFFKVRASVGKLGNERIGNYPYQSTIAFNEALFYQGSNVTSLTTAAQIEYAIRNVTWESTETFDLGLDINFFDNQLFVSGDYYTKVTSDMLLDLNIPDFIGYDDPQQNTGRMKTHGWDLQIGWRDHMGQIEYRVSANISDYESIMGDLGGTQFLGNKIKTEGSEFDEWYGYLSEGLFQTQEEVDNSAKLNSSVKPGDIKYIDISGPDGTPDGIISPDYDRVLLGGSLPRFIYGGNIGLNYNNFDLSLVFHGVGKQQAHLSPDMVRPLSNSAQNAPSIVDGNYWSVYNTDQQNRNVSYPRLSEIGANNNNYVLSDYWLFDGAFFRLKNISLSYNLPQNIIDRLGLQGVRINGTASDLFSLDNYPKGWDPEAAINVYPITRSLIFGISIKI